MAGSTKTCNVKKEGKMMKEQDTKDWDLVQSVALIIYIKVVKLG